MKREAACRPAAATSCRARKRADATVRRCDGRQPTPGVGHEASQRVGQVRIVRRALDVASGNRGDATASDDATQFAQAVGFRALHRSGTCIAIPSRPPAGILMPIDHPIRACRRYPLTGAEEKRRPITFETFLNGALSGFLTPRRNEFARVLAGARVCDRDRISGTTGQPECGPNGNLKNETSRICRARAGLIGKPLNANGKGICASRTPRYRAAPHVSALKHAWRAEVARGWPCRVKNPTVCLYSGRLAAWHR